MQPEYQELTWSAAEEHRWALACPPDISDIDGVYDAPPGFMPELPWVMPNQWHRSRFVRQRRHEVESRIRDQFGFVLMAMEAVTPQESLDRLHCPDISVLRRAQCRVDDGHKIVHLVAPQPLGKEMWGLGIVTLPPCCVRLRHEAWQEHRRTSWLY